MCELIFVWPYLAVMFSIKCYKYFPLTVSVGSDKHYNSVWEEELGVCYSLIQCPAKCNQCVGVHIHVSKVADSPLTDKVRARRK